LWHASARADASLVATPPPESAEALGEGATTLIVLIADDPSDAVTARLERDLRSQGLSVMLLRATPENASDVAALERCARGFGGIGAVHVLSNARGSELWLLEPTTAQTVARSLVRPARPNADPNEVVLGTLELLRASLMELHQSRRRPVVVPPAPPVAQVPVPTASQLGHFSLAGALGADLGLRSSGPSLSTVWAAWLRLRDCFGVRGFLSLPLTAERDRVAEGRVEVEPLIAGAGMSCSFAHRSSRLWPRASLGVAGAHVVTRGTAVDPLRSHQAAAWLVGGFGLLGLGLRITRDVHLNLDVTGVLLPSPAVVFVADRQVATWGAPASVVSLGVEVLAAP
jgi:hypothetical protein